MNDGLSAYELIKQAILDGDLPPEHKLVETVLAQQFSVSRTPIREALTRLEQDGLAERTPRGLFVRQRSVEEILDIYDTRCVLEAMAGRVAAERRTEHDLRLLTQIVDSAAGIDTAKSDSMANYNRQFHRAIWRATHNETLLDLLERLDLHLGRYPETTLAYPHRWDQSISEHRALVDAIGHRDEAAASEIASRHFVTARDIRLKLSYGDLTV